MDKNTQNTEQYLWLENHPMWEKAQSSGCVALTVLINSNRKGVCLIFTIEKQISLA